MITLCPTTYEIAQKMPNFSAWVRNRLRDLQDYTPDNNQVKPDPPKNYMCKHCLGNHWTADCKEMNA